MASQWVFSSNRGAGTVGCICYILQHNRSIDSKRQFLDRVTVAFSERYVNPLRLIRPILPSKTIAGSLFHAARHF
jgi:hypothetical protein